MGVVTANSAEEWAQVISESFVPLSLGGVVGSFSGSVEQAVLLPGVTVTDIHTHGGSAVLRTPRLVRAGHRDDYLFSLHLGGAGAVVQDDREATLESGGGALYRTARPYRLIFPDSCWEIALQAPRDMLRDRMPGADVACGRGLPSRQPATRVLAVFLRELVGVAETLPPEQRAELGWTAMDLLATALRAASGEGNAIPSGRQALLVSMRSFVSEHLAAPDLTPALLARRHGISLRYVTELFTEAGTSPAAYIRSERLRTAHLALSDPRQSHRTIAAIAARAGFADRTTFTRAFVRQYGVTPADLRAGHRSE